MGTFDTSVDYGNPVAAPLERVAEILGQPVERVVQAAEQVPPYRRADGGLVWSVTLLGIELGVRRSRLEKARRRNQRSPEALERRREQARQRDRQRRLEDEAAG